MRNNLIVRHTTEEHSFLASRPQRATKPQRLQPIIFIHGMFGFALYFSNLMHYFTALGFTCYAPDIMGHGERAHIDVSKMGVHDYIAEMAEFVRFVETRHVAPPVIVGHSMGGLIAAKLSECPSVGHTVLITPAPPKGVLLIPGVYIQHIFEGIFRAMWSSLHGERFVPSQRALESQFVDPKGSKDAIAMLLKHRINTESHFVALELGTSYVPVNKNAIKTPMLVIGARKDVVIHHWVAGRVATHLGADFHMLDALGHMCPFEAGWEATALVIHEWLKKTHVM